MIKEKELKELQGRIKQYLIDQAILTKQKIEDVDFFLKNAKDSLQSAQCLFEISTKHDYKGYDDLAGFLWVINAGYYSMFYTARALLENAGIKLKKELSIHLLTFDALVYYFYLTGKLQKQLVEYYALAQEESIELLGQKKADELIQEYFYEKGKRAAFTYEIGGYAMENKAKTSLQRAAKFNIEIRKILM
ncbi:hypothetical protein HYX16_00410 [Candidatus Woesearchaeota archaeon]|nr:hypothetical protein [Candidatus Woesearchaeota archaeon]